MCSAYEECHELFIYFPNATMSTTPEESPSKKDEQADEHDKQQAAELIELCTESETLLFRDQLNDAYAFFPGRKRTKMLRRIKSDDFAHWLRWLYYQETGGAIGKEALQKAVELCECRALFEGPEHPLYNRIAPGSDEVIYNLCNETNQIVRISENGFIIVIQTHPLFRYYRHQRTQITPADEGDIRELLPFINLKSGNRDMGLLLLVYIVSCFISEYPHVILLLSGEKGSAKSTLLRIIRRLVDPAKPLLLRLRKKIDELPQQLDQNYYVPYDNVREISGEVSDMFCRASTGDGDSKRSLYSDDGTFNREYMRCVALDGINVCASEPDLLDRCLLIELERIPKNKRRLEKEFWKSFDAAVPRILHGIFQVLSRAMKYYGRVEVPEGRNRMADFEHWGCAIAEALGYSAADFIAAYERNIGVQTQAAIDESDVAQCVVALMEREEGCPWEGTATALLEALNNIALDEKINTKDPAWPKQGSSLSKRIRSILSNLRDVGIHVSFPPRDCRSRKVLIEKVGKKPPSLATTEIVPTESQEAGDGIRKTVTEVFEQLSPESRPQEAETQGGDGSDSSAEVVSKVQPSST